MEANPDPRPRSWLPWLGGLMLMLLLATGLGLTWLARHAEPLLRARLIAMLTARFHRPVELDGLHISVLHGLQVEATGLRILALTGPATPDARPSGAPPMVSVRSFQFHTGLRELFEPTLRVTTVHVQGAEIRIPPKEERGPLISDHPDLRSPPADGILVDKLLFDDLKVIVETRRPGKTPLEFDIANLTLDNVGRRLPFTYDATLRNPKPVGDVRATGHFGPWQDDTPRDTPLDGSYIFSHADLSTIKGLGGTLASNGRFAGTLSRIAVDGTSDTPDFHLSTSGHPLPLHTDFHVLVDATNGDTTLEPVNARLAHSTIVATGSVTHQKGIPGHDVELEINLRQARLEDILSLAVRTYPAVVHGSLVSHAHVSIPPGPGTVSHRMRLEGSYEIEQAAFTNQRLQTQIDEVSERALNWAERANPQQAAPITLSMKGTFHLADEVTTIPDMAVNVPGATLHVQGQYGLDGATMDFHGTVRTQATASEMVGGWKGLLLMPFDHYLQKTGTGMEVPFKLSGTQKDPKLALDFGHNKPQPH